MGFLPPLPPPPRPRACADAPTRPLPPLPVDIAARLARLPGVRAVPPRRPDYDLLGPRADNPVHVDPHLGTLLLGLGMFGIGFVAAAVVLVGLIFTLLGGGW